MAEFLVKHICGGVVLLAISFSAYLLYCGIGNILLRLRANLKRH